MEWLSNRIFDFLDIIARLISAGGIGNLRFFPSDKSNSVKVRYCYDKSSGEHYSWQVCFQGKCLRFTTRRIPAEHRYCTAFRDLSPESGELSAVSDIESGNWTDDSLAFIARGEKLSGHYEIVSDLRGNYMLIRTI